MYTCIYVYMNICVYIKSMCEAPFSGLIHSQGLPLVAQGHEFCMYACVYVCMYVYMYV